MTEVKSSAVKRASPAGVGEGREVGVLLTPRGAVVVLVVAPAHLAAGAVLRTEPERDADVGLRLLLAGGCERRKRLRCLIGDLEHLRRHRAELVRGEQRREPEASVAGEDAVQLAVLVRPRCWTRTPARRRRPARRARSRPCHRAPGRRRSCCRSAEAPRRRTPTRASTRAGARCSGRGGPVAPACSSTRAALPRPLPGPRRRRPRWWPGPCSRTRARSCCRRARRGIPPSRRPVAPR